MALLIVGLILWTAAHFFKRFLPDARANLGDPGKGLVAVLVVGSIVLMVLGYRAANTITIWQPPSFMVHVNNLLMIFAFWVYGSSAAKGAKAWPAYHVRHPQLFAMSIWAFAHLLANGDLASILLFGGLLAWALVTVRLINRDEPEWTRPEPAGSATYIRLAVITVVMVLIVTGVHTWLGVWPFPS